MTPQPPYFHTPLRIEKIGPRDWRLLEHLVFESALLKGPLMVPAGAVVNFASTPRFLWSLVPPSGAYDFGCCLHDAGYRGTLQTMGGQRIRLIRELCDKLMDEANEATGVSGPIRFILYRGVRLFAAGAYKGVPDGV